MPQNHQFNHRLRGGRLCGVLHSLPCLPCSVSFPSIEWLLLLLPLLEASGEALSMGTLSAGCVKPFLHPLYLNLLLVVRPASRPIPSLD